MKASYRFVLFVLILITGLDIYQHTQSFSVPRPTEPLDPPFQTQCLEPHSSGVNVARENAVIVMLARNSDIDGAASAIGSLEQHFNRWFHYDIVFLNDEPWDDEFVTRLREITSGESKFVTIPRRDWGYPDWIDQDAVRDSFPLQKEQGSLHAEKESYHHMCRYQSGRIFDHEALAPYKWYWRVEPDVEFTCSIT